MRAISTLGDKTLKLADKFTYLISYISSIESDVNIVIIWKSDPSDKMKQNFFQALVLLIFLYGYATSMIAKHIMKNLDGNNTRRLRAILDKSWKQHLRNNSFTAT